MLPELAEQLVGVVRVDRHLRAAEQRCVHAGRKRHSQRVVRGDGDHPGVGADEALHVVRIAHDDVVAAELAGQTRSRIRSPAGARLADPSGKRVTSFQRGYRLSSTFSIQTGMDAAAIWMKYPL
jgi:hypothetical protein